MNKPIFRVGLILGIAGWIIFLINRFIQPQQAWNILDRITLASGIIGSIIALIGAVIENKR